VHPARPTRPPAGRARPARTPRPPPDQGLPGRYSPFTTHPANWRLSPLSAVSEDNLPNATPGAYVPKVRPAIGNLMTMFDFRDPDFATLQLPG
jgi:hypothetical protein